MEATVDAGFWYGQYVPAHDVVDSGNAGLRTHVEIRPPHGCNFDVAAASRNFIFCGIGS